MSAYREIGMAAVTLVNVNSVAEALRVSWPTANKLVQQFEGAGLLSETTGQKRNRVYRYDPYLALFAESEPATDEVATQTTEAPGPSSEG